MADLASFLQDRPSLPNVMPREMRQEPLGQSNLLPRFLRSFGQPSADALQRGFEGKASPQEIAKTFLETGPFLTLGVGRVGRPQKANAQMSQSRFDLTPSPQMRTIEIGPDQPVQMNYRVRDHGVHLSDIYVDPSMRGQGHGRAAMEAFLQDTDAARKPVSLIVQGESEAGDLALGRFYRSLGFRDDGGVWSRPVGGQPWYRRILP